MAAGSGSKWIVERQNRNLFIQIHTDLYTNTNMKNFFFKNLHISTYIHMYIYILTTYATHTNTLLAALFASLLLHIAVYICKYLLYTHTHTPVVWTAPSSCMPFREHSFSCHSFIRTNISCVFAFWPKGFAVTAFLFFFFSLSFRLLFYAAYVCIYGGVSACVCAHKAPMKSLNPYISQWI